jgi:hypothetical protein
VRLQKELDLLNQEDIKINKALSEAKEMLENSIENEHFEKYGYVTFEDIKSLTNGNDVNLIAIKAPPNTSLDIPDPDQIVTIHNEVRKVFNFIILSLNKMIKNFFFFLIKKKFFQNIQKEKISDFIKI